MVAVCFYFQVHQPYRLAKYRIFDIGRNHNYFDEAANRQILNKVAEKCYLPTNALLYELLQQHPELKLSFSFSGIVLEQFEKYRPEVLDSFKRLVSTGRVELISETYYHSLASIYSKPEFVSQVKLHRAKLAKLFGYRPKVFRNTELIYSNQLGKLVADMGFKGILAEGTEKVLGWRSPNFVYHHPELPSMKILLKNYRLSDDIAFRFSTHTWSEFPLTAPKFASWIHGNNGNGHVVNLFMDYETFGEHQWQETGIFEFLRHLPKEILSHPDGGFVTPSEAIALYQSLGDFHAPHLISWADIERDTSAWVGNDMQRAAVEYLYELETDVKKTGDKEIIEDWRKLQTSDHFYYMCTKWFNDGDVHKYFNPYDSPYDAFINFNNILNDLVLRVEAVNGTRVSCRHENEFRLKIEKRGEVNGKT